MAAAQLISAYNTTKQFIKSGIVAVKDKISWQDRCKILLIGETGSGKTSFLNLICNYNLVQTLGFQAGVEQFQNFHKIEFESDTSKMESKTNNATMYKITIKDWQIGVIDTPGFGDSRGLDEDKKHVSKIIETLKDETYIHCVCLVTNGRASRMSGSLKYVLSEITAILPKTVVNNVIVVFTNTTSSLHLTFDINELKNCFGCDISHNYCIENPYCLYEKAKENPRGMSKLMIAEGLKDEFEKTAKVLDRMFNDIKKFEQVHTNDFLMLYQKKQEVERTVLITLAKYDDQMKLEKQILAEQEKLSAASRSKSFYEGFENEIETTEPEDTEHHNTICGAPGCFSNCHVPCSLPKSYDKEMFKRCWCIENETCRVCGHDYRNHYHNEVFFKKSKKKTIDKETKKKYDAAKSAEEKSRIAKEDLESKKIKSEQEKKRLSQSLVAAMREFEALGLNRNYLLLLQNQLYLIEQYLEADGGNRKYLEETKKDLQKRIIVVEESFK